MARHDIKKYLIVALLLIIAYISYLIVKSFITPLLTSFVLTYLFFPVFKKIKNVVRNKILAAFITTFLIILVILIPMIFMAKALVTESVILYKNGVIDNITQFFLKYTGENSYLDSSLNNIINGFVSYIEKLSTNFLISLPSKIFHILIIIYATFSLFLVGEDFLKKSKNLLPTKNKDDLIKHLGDTTYSIFYGMFTTAILEFIISFIVFKFIIGSSIALLLALLVGFLAFIPFLGPGLVWIPYSILEIVRNNYTSAIIIIILGIVLFLIETFLKSNIISKHSKVHPVIVLIGTIGGIQTVGFIGLVIGPIILSSVIIIIKEYYPEIKNEV